MVFSLWLWPTTKSTRHKCRQIEADFDGHAAGAIRCDAHLSMEHIPVFNRSHWMLPSVECSHRIAAAAAMVNDFG
jgi:hypothetical protein